MHIFSKYRQHESYNEFILIQNAIRNISDDSNKNNFLISSLIEQILSSKIIYSRAIACVLAYNLKFNAQISSYIINNLIQRLYNFLLANNNIYPIFIMECFGLFDQYNFNYSQLKYKNTKLFIENNSKSGIFFYKPKRSGFFSIIENIISAEIYAYMNNKKLVILYDKSWWPYNDDFRNIFSNSFEISSNASLINYFNSLSFRTHRRWSLTLKNQYWDHYECLKSSKYLSIYNDLKRYLIKNSISIHNNENKMGFYIRRGDKIVLEDIYVPISCICSHLSILLNKYGSLHIVSDDMVWCIDNLQKFDLRISFDTSTSKGYFFGSENQNDHIDIIRKYINLVDIDLFTGDIGSNLVNAIAYTRKGMNKEPIFCNQLFSTNPTILM